MKKEALLKTLWQVFAIARTEFRFSFRRSAPVVTMALIGFIVGIGILVVPIGALKDWDDPSKNLTTEQVEKLAGEGMSLEDYDQLIRNFTADWFSGSGILLSSNILAIALILLPIATVSALPADRKFDVLEVLRSTPLTGGSYLAGKILGVLAALLLIGLGTFLLFIAALDVVLFHFLGLGISSSTLILFLQYSLMDGLPIVAFGSLTGVLVGVLFRTRRAALFPGFITGGLNLYFWLSAFKAPKSIFPVLDKATYYALQNSHSVAFDRMAKLVEMEGISHLGEDVPILGIGQVLLMYGIIFSVLIGLIILARLFLHWKENF